MASISLLLFFGAHHFLFSLLQIIIMMQQFARLNFSYYSRSVGRAKYLPSTYSNVSTNYHARPPHSIATQALTAARVKEVSIFSLATAFPLLLRITHSRKGRKIEGSLYSSGQGKCGDSDQTHTHTHVTSIIDPPFGGSMRVA